MAVSENSIKRTFTKRVSWLMAVAGLLALPLVLQTDYQVHMAVIICINIILAVGLNLVMGFAGQINIGHYGLYAIGAYSSALLSVRLGLSFWLALPSAVLITGIFGVVVGFPAIKLERVYLALATLGLAESVRIILNNSRWSGQSMGVPGIPSPAISGFVFDTPTRIYYLYLPFLLLTLLVNFNIINSTMGRRFRAVRDDPLAANVLGVNVRRVRLVAFVISALYGGLAGSLYAHYAGYVSPTIFITNLQITFLLMIVLGGLGYAWGGIVGAILVTVIYEYTRQFVQYQMMVFGFAMVLIVIFLNKGIVGFLRDSITQIGHRRNENQEG